VWYIISFGHQSDGASPLGISIANPMQPKPPYCGALWGAAPVRRSDTCAPVDYSFGLLALHLFYH